MKENKVSREYKYWDKYLSKREQRVYFSLRDSGRMLPKKQIERSRKKLTPEQLTELLERYDALKRRALNTFIRVNLQK